MKQPEAISYDLVKGCIDKFKANEGVGEEALKMIFEDYPNNGDETHVMIKATVLDKIYSTRIRYVDFPFIIQNIVERSAEINELLKSSEREYKLYYLIAEPNKEFVNKKGKTEKVHNVYSFATKYLSFTKQDLYPIMDSYSKELLNKYCKIYPKLPKLSVSTNKYEQFCNTFDAFRALVNNTVSDETDQKFNLKEIDMFIWQYAKDLMK